MDSLALKFTMVFLFFRISFLHEFLAARLHVDLHILMLLGGLSLLTAFLSGNLTRGFQSRTAKFWFCYAACVTGATVTSTWRGGSLPVLIDFLRTALPLILLIPAVVNSNEDLTKVMKAIGWAGIATIAIGFTTKEMSQGRLVLKDAPSIGNSNDYAAYLIYVFPFVMFLLYSRNAKAIHKLLGLIVVPAGLYQILSTGSRGGLVAMAVMMLVVLWMSSTAVRLSILVGVPILALAALPFVPAQSLERMESLFKSSEQGPRTEAAESRQARTLLLEESIRLTFQNPLLGVGPAQFQTSENDAAKAAGRKGMWHETHNTFTQVSSECGIPALIFFLCALATAFRSLFKLKRDDDPLISGLARIVLISMVGFSASIFFLSHAYDFPLIISCSLAITMLQLSGLRKPGVAFSHAPQQAHAA
jgi:hypothetical protein